MYEMRSKLLLQYNVLVVGRGHYSFYRFFANTMFFLHKKVGQRKKLLLCSSSSFRFIMWNIPGSIHNFLLKQNMFLHSIIFLYKITRVGGSRRRT